MLYHKNDLRIVNLFPMARQRDRAESSEISSVCLSNDLARTFAVTWRQLMQIECRLIDSISRHHTIDHRTMQFTANRCYRKRPLYYWESLCWNVIIRNVQSVLSYLLCRKVQWQKIYLQNFRVIKIILFMDS